MAGTRAALLALSVAALVCSSVAAAPKRRKPPATPSLPSNLPPARAPLPSGARSEVRGASPAASPSASRPAAPSLIPGVPDRLAAAAGGGLVLLLVVLLLVVRGRRSVRPVASVQQRPQRPPGRERVERADPTARPSRKRKATHLATSRETSTPSVDISPAQAVLLARSERAPSLHDTLLALGPDLLAWRCLREVAREKLDALAWASTVKDRRAQRLNGLTAIWSRQLALRRVVAWLEDHPLVKESGLEVQVPGTLEPSDLPNLTLTQRDGLGVTLSAEQSALLDHARAALVQAFANQPFALLAASSALGALLPAELQRELEQGHPPHALPLLLGGLPALDWAAQVGLSRPGIGAEFREALHEHTKLVGTPVPAEGQVAHAIEVLGGGRLDGIGLLLAAVAGAAFSSTTVILRISKRIGETPSDTLGALSRLGALACAALDDEASPDHPVLQGNVSFLCGEPLLERESKRAAALLKEAERLAGREPLWKGGAAADLETPDLALVGLYESQVKLGLSRSVQARERMLDLLDRLAHPGGAGEEAIGYRRLGYVLAGLGAPMLRNTSTELLSAGREAMALTADADADLPSLPRG